MQLRWSRTSLCKIIGHLYRSKIAADLSDLADGSAVQTMREFVYDFFLIKTGLRVMAEVNFRGRESCVILRRRPSPLPLPLPRVGSSRTVSARAWRAS